ncbi:MAG: adenylate/guanylate cyclase domain-containing protein, partial [Aureliella sp.]
EVHYRFFQNTRLLGEGTVEVPFTVGRQTDVGVASPVSVFEVPPNSKQYIANECVTRKLVIVPLSNRTVPRLSLKVDVDKSGNILARNVHRSVELHLLSRELLRPNEQLLLGAEGTVCFPDEYQLRLSFHHPVSRVRSESEAVVESPPGSAFAPMSTPPKITRGTVQSNVVSARPQPNPQSLFGSNGGRGKGTLRIDDSTDQPVADSADRLLQDSPSDESSSDKPVGSSVVPNSLVPPSKVEGTIRGSYVALERVLDEAESSPMRSLSLLADSKLVNQQELAVRLVHTALEAFKKPPGSKEFFDAASQAALQMIGLDRVAVLRKEQGAWVCRTLVFRPGLDQTRAAARRFSHALLAQMELNGRTTSVDPQFDSADVSQALQDVDRAVAAPIFDENKKIVAALYGDRLMGESENSEPIGELEAALLEVLASGISSSIALKQEQLLRSSMAPFFSPVVLEQLHRDRTLLAGRVADVSVLFCDIRGFSTVTERIGPAQSIAWINDIFTTLSDCVLAHDGVLVDYIGDELMAMWGAPGDQPDHAARACRAALEMLEQVVPLGEKWENILQVPFGLGIGINSGQASVGNTGSTKKFKYGPLGNTVNMASRVQGITKQIGVSGLVSGQTAELASQVAQFQTRRLAKVRVVGIAQPLDIFELCQQVFPRDLAVRYEAALGSYEDGDLQVAAGRLASLVQDYPDDRPTIILLSRTVEMLTQPVRPFDPVWNLSHK